MLLVRTEGMEISLILAKSLQPIIDLFQVSNSLKSCVPSCLDKHSRSRLWAMANVTARQTVTQSNTVVLIHTGSDCSPTTDSYMLYPDSVFISLRPLNSIRDNIRSAVNPCQHFICLGIIGKLFVISHKLQHTAKTIRDIGQVRKCS